MRILYHCTTWEGPVFVAPENSDSVGRVKYFSLPAAVVSVGSRYKFMRLGERVTFRQYLIRW